MEKNNNINRNSAGGNDDLTARELMSFLWNLRFWIALSAFIALCCAVLYVKLSTPVYKRNAQVMLANERSGNTELQLVAELSGMKQSSLIDNEVFIFRSPSLMTKVVNELGLNVRYYRKHQFGLKTSAFKKMEFYGDSPVKASFIFDPLYPEQNRPGTISLEFSPVNRGSFSLRKLDFYRSEKEEQSIDKKKVYNYGDTLTFGEVRFVIDCIEPEAIENGDRLYCSWCKPYSRGTDLSKKLTATVEPGVTGKMSKTDVITLSIEDTKPQRANDILNTMIVKYNEEAREYKNASTKASIEFIDRRLETIAQELGQVESSFRSYQSSKTLVNIEAQSELTLTTDMQYQNQLTEIRLQQSVLDMINEEMKDMKDGEYRVIPSNIGLTDVSLNQVINTYNTLVAERNRMVANSSENNPRVKSIDMQLRDGRKSIILSIDNLEKVYRIREKEINDVLSKSKAKISQIPGQQFDLTQIARKQQIIEPLYLLLQQKKEEAQITMFTITDNARVIEASFGQASPISPNTSKILLLALILGCCIPPGLVLLRNLLKTEVETKEDIEKVLDESIIAVIPKCEDHGLIRTSNSRDSKAESFRMLRSNLDYINGTVIQVTSSIPGEGKSFVAANLASSLAHTGKKVALLGLDLRKPALPKIITELTLEREKSIVAYLIGKTDNPLDCIKSSSTANLDVAFSGAIPPNPNELLASERLETLIKYFRDNYDYVICDSAPMMPVSDSFIVNKFVDATVYVIRSEYTALKMLPEIDSLFRERGIKSPSLVLNSMDVQSKSFRYGYGYGYGSYGYGYGYGYGYDEDGKKSGKLSDKMMRKFKKKNG